MFHKRFLPLSLALVAAFALVFVAGRYSPRADASPMVKAANSINAEAINPATTFADAKMNDDIGAAYVALAMSPSTSRRAMYSELSAKQKKAIWFLHLTLIRLSYTHSDLTRDQEAFFQKAGVMLYGTDFDNLAKNQAEVAKARALTDEADSLFGKGAAKFIFGDLGGALSVAGRGQPVGQKIAAFFADCACNDYWNFCGGSQVCKKQDSAVCTTTNSGCGVLWAYPCNGQCKDDNAE